MILPDSQTQIVDATTNSPAAKADRLPDDLPSIKTMGISISGMKALHQKIRAAAHLSPFDPHPDFNMRKLATSFKGGDNEILSGYTVNHYMIIKPKKMVRVGHCQS
jgi:hypothetical protein